MSSPIEHNRRKRQAEDDVEEDNSQANSSPIPSSPPLPSSPAIPYADEEEEIHNDVADLNPSEDEEEGVDLMDDMERDYRANEKEDRYDISNIDDEEYEEMDIGDRRKIDERLNRNDMIFGRERGADNMYLDDGSERDEELNEFGLPFQRRRRRRYEDEDDAMLADEDIEPFNEELSLESLTDVKAASITEWILQPAVSRSIARELKSFLLEYTDEKGRSVYGARIRTLGEINSESLDLLLQLKC
ncbi:hypothetical protein QCA50_017649 [Cerrena zonata]|uniref:Uncharacterized protein n=1 Tax=Cerrena zonata TaxID=2478898 RepID=A0AAW0FK05_9APHY